MNHLQLADELAVRDLAARFTDAVNRNDPAALGALFAAGGEWIVPGMDTTVGPAAAAERIRGLRETFVHLIQVLHSGHVDLDGDSATAAWYLSETAATDDGSGFAFTGVYHDDLRRTDDGWRFARRRFTFLYRGKAELTGKWYGHPTAPASRST